SGNEIVNIRDISTVSLRIAREIIGCGEFLAEDISKNNGGLLLCGAPISGKTTVLRDIARLLSTTYNRRVSVVDSRGELSAVKRGIPQLDVGLCDVLSFYPRALGIEQSVRCLSPEFIICDEIGSLGDADAIITGINSGVNFIATAHASSKEELLKKINIKNLLDLGAFRNVAFLKGRTSPGEVQKIYEIGEILSA
ncbi:MAG: stage III sporulation protein AA, partial [Eubacteriales bacterium]|nr:stage III sporulation protein AA [Eubacteriales bacterium]